VACGATAPADAGKPKPQFNEPANVTKPGESYTATMQTSCGTIVIALEPKLAPNTVNSIVFLAGQHLFDGTTFHRIAKGFVIQGGDPMGTGSGGPGYTTVDPPPSGAKYPVGTVAMAKASTDPAGTSGSQFFIVTSPSAQAALAPGGTGQYAIVGKVVSGIDIVRRIAALPIHGGGTDGAPAQAVYIDSLRVKAEAR
jgi:peptidyl-prolyl cis-trans isomerase B (cyclophilin B)